MDSQVEYIVNELAEILHKLLTVHGKLLEKLDSKQDALRSAGYQDLTDICDQENKLVQEISELEKHRLRLIASLTLRIDPQASEPMRLMTVAERLEEPWRGKLLVLRQQLLDRAKAVRSKAKVVRRSTETLVTHMQGLVQTIGTVCGGVGLYGRDGTPPGEAMALRTVNMTA